MSLTNLKTITLVMLSAWLTLTIIPGPVYCQETPAAPPFEALKIGDWWQVKVEQMTPWKRTAQQHWVEAGVWKFVVRAKDDQKMVVEVTNPDRPKDSQLWSLTLVYNGSGEVIDATYKIGERTFTGDAALETVPLGKEGLSIGKSWERVKEAPITAMGIDIQTSQPIEMARIDLDKIDGYQLWRPQETWWRYFKKKKGLPVRAELKRTSWWSREQKKE
jgi:hypothetical protein